MLVSNLGTSSFPCQRHPETTLASVREMGINGKHHPQLAIYFKPFIGVMTLPMTWMMVSDIFFYFSQSPWKMIQFDEHIFQIGWVQPPTRTASSPLKKTLPTQKERIVFQAIHFRVQTLNLLLPWKSNRPPFLSWFCIAKHHFLLPKGLSPNRTIIFEMVAATSR